MTDKREGFDINRLDQQVEDPAGSLDAQTGQLVEELLRMYTPSHAETCANVESLRRVQQRLQARFGAAHQETKMISHRVLQTRQKRKSLMIEKSSERKARWQRVSHIFNTLVAVLVVAILVSSAVALAMLKNRPQVPQGPGVGSHAQATPTPTAAPSHDCSHIFTTAFGLKAYTMDTLAFNGEHAICLKGLETALHGTQEVNGHQVTLISAYADSNRLLLKYSVSGHLSTSDQIFGPVELILQDGTKLQYYGGADDADVGPQQTIGLYSYDTQQVPAGTTSLQIADATFQGLATAMNVATETDHATFAFTIPFHGAKRVATPNQTVKISGHTFTCERVVVTESQTRVYLKVDPAFVLTSSLVATINGANLRVEPGDKLGKNAVEANFLGLAEEDFMNTQGVWTITLRGEAGTLLTTGSGSIQFTVPPSN